MSFVITEPYQFIAGLDGEALDAGSIYYGQPNQDPVQYPKTVYYDVDLSIPAPQPLRTVNGYIVRNGKPSFLFADGNYSILVLDKHGRQVFYVADFFLVGNAVPLMLSQISAPILNIAALRALDKTKYRFAQTSGYYTANDGGSGRYYLDVADTTSVDNGGTVIVATDGGRWKLITNEVYNVKQWGLKGDGTTDETSLLQAMIDLVPDGSTIRFPATEDQYVIIPATSIAYKDRFNVTRKTGIQVTSRNHLTFQFDEGAKILVNGSDAERVAFFFKSCNNITINDIYYPNVSGSTSIAGSTYLVTEDYYPLAFEGNNGFNINGFRSEACRSALFMDAMNGLQNKNFKIDGMFTYQTCNYSLITRNADNIHVLNARLEQTGRTWNTSNEDIAFSDTSTNCKATNCDALNPLGRVSRFGVVNNVGPTVIENCRLTGEGIWIEINQGSNIQVIGGYSKRGTGERISEHILFTSDDFINNANVSVVGAQFFGGGLIVADYYPLGWSGADIEGFLMEGCIAQDTFGIEMSLSRIGSVFTGNRFNLNSGGILLRLGGKGTVFDGNAAKNAYVRVDGDNFIATGNNMTGNVGTPIAFTWDVQGCIGFVENNNTYTTATYTQFFNHTPGSRFSAKYLGVGHDSNPQFSLASFVTGVAGDIWPNSNPAIGGPQGWECNTGGNPGVWHTFGQKGYRTSAGAPSVNANFVMEELLDTTNNKWYKAKNTGTGASDWVALN